MRHFVHLVSFTGMILLSFFSLSMAGETGNVAGRFLYIDKDEVVGVGFLPKIVSLLGADQRLDSDLGNDGSFRFFDVAPGHYDLMIGESIVIKPELEVLPDLTANVTIDLARPDEFKDVRVIKLGRLRALKSYVLTRPCLIYPDKTFSGSVIWGDEAQRSREKPLELNFKTYGRLRGYVLSPATAE